MYILRFSLAWVGVGVLLLEARVCILDFEVGDSRKSAPTIRVIMKISIRSPAAKISSARFSVKSNFYLFWM